MTSRKILPANNPSLEKFSKKRKQGKVDREATFANFVQQWSMDLVSGDCQLTKDASAVKCKIAFP